ncbi:RHS repeat domain-containing protein, partial [Xanthomonas albilineans]
GIDERYARDDNGGRTYFLTDLLGSTRLLTDTNGNAVQRYDYDPYGATTQSSTSYSNPYQYTGREHDQSGLYYYRARYYTAELGRFISEDPLQLAAGPNSYSYVNDDPASLIDPLGLEAGAAYRAIYLADGGNANSPIVGSHNYSIWVPLCADGCTPAEAFDAMRKFSAPGAPPAQDGSRNLVLPGVTHGNPINQTVDPCSKTIVNVALPGHQFGGSVTISIQERDDVIGAQIVGTGIGPNPIVNQLMGPIIFDYLGYSAAKSLQGSGK